MQPAGNHQVQHQPEIAFHSNRDALADAPQFSHHPSFHIRYRGLHGAQQKRTGQPHLLDPLSDDARFERGDVSGDIGQFRHAGQGLALTTQCLCEQSSMSVAAKSLPFASKGSPANFARA